MARFGDFYVHTYAKGIKSIIQGSSASDTETRLISFVNHWLTIRPTEEILFDVAVEFQSTTRSTSLYWSRATTRSLLRGAGVNPKAPTTYEHESFGCGALMGGRGQVTAKRYGTGCRFVQLYHTDKNMFWTPTPIRMSEPSLSDCLTNKVSTYGKYVNFVKLRLDDTECSQNYTARIEYRVVSLERAVSCIRKAPTVSYNSDIVFCSVQNYAVQTFKRCMLDIYSSIFLKSRMFLQLDPNRLNFLKMIRLLLLGLNRSIVHIAQSQIRKPIFQYTIKSIQKFNFPYMDATRVQYGALRYREILDDQIRSNYELLDLPFGNFVPEGVRERFPEQVKNWYDVLATFYGEESLDKTVYCLINILKQVLLDAIPHRYITGERSLLVYSKRELEVSTRIHVDENVFTGSMQLLFDKFFPTTETLSNDSKLWTRFPHAYMLTHLNKCLESKGQVKLLTELEYRLKVKLLDMEVFPKMSSDRIWTCRDSVIQAYTVYNLPILTPHAIPKSGNGRRKLDDFAKEVFTLFLKNIWDCLPGRKLLFHTPEVNLICDALSTRDESALRYLHSLEFIRKSLVMMSVRRRQKNSQTWDDRLEHFFPIDGFGGSFSRKLLNLEYVSMWSDFLTNQTISSQEKSMVHSIIRTSFFKLEWLPANEGYQKLWVKTNGTHYLYKNETLV